MELETENGSHRRIKRELEWHSARNLGTPDTDIHPDTGVVALFNPATT